MDQQRNNFEDDDMIGNQPIEIDRLIRHREYFTGIRNYDTLRLLGVILMAFICGIIITILVTFYLADEPTHSNNEKNSVLPRQTQTLTDWGCSTRFHDWVDVQGQGIPNDYARYVGPTAEYSFVWFSVALAGSTEQYTNPGVYEEQSGIVRRTLVKPRQIIPDIDKLGLPYHFRGWVDVQNQGVANDYAYYVGPTEDIPFLWLTVALAGSSERRTCVGLYMEKYGVVRPTLGKLHYDQDIVINCQYWDSLIRRFRQTLSEYNLYNLNSIQTHSQLVAEQIIVQNLPNKNITSEMAITLWKKLLPGDIFTVVSMTINNSVSKTFSVQVLAVMLGLVGLHYIFRFTRISFPIPI